MACSSRQRLQLSTALQTEIHAVTRDNLCLFRQPVSNSRISSSRNLNSDLSPPLLPGDNDSFCVYPTRLRASNYLVALLTCCRSCLAILLESIPFYLFFDPPTARRLRPRYVHVHTTPRIRRHLQSTTIRNQRSTELEIQTRQKPAILSQPWLHRHFDQLPRSRPRSRAHLVRYPGRTPTNHFHKSPTIPASCLPQSSSSVPFPTTRGRILRVEEVCTKWRNNRTRLVGGGPVPSSKSTMNPPSQSSSSVTAPPCPTAMQTGSTQKVCCSSGNSGQISTSHR